MTDRRACGCGKCTGRRYILGWLAGGVAFVQLGPAAAQSDLLDPGKVGKASAATTGANADDLLDIDAVKSSRPSAAAKEEVGSTKRWPPPYARGMAATVVTSMAGLAADAMRLIAEVKRLQQRKSDLERELADLVEQMNIKMEEYRSGLFCSGCEKTKSEILAKGETFPHPGQRVIRPTQDQIDAKERELRAPIDRIRGELDAVLKALAEATANRDEALDQLEHGLKLWRTAITFEYELLALADHDDAAAHKQRLEDIDRQLHRISLERMANKDKRQVEVLDRDWGTWTEMRDELETQREKRRRANEKERERAAMTAGGEKRDLDGYIHSGEIWHFIASRPNTAPIPDVGLGGLGGFYRMGNHDPKHGGTVLPNVRAFIDRFSASPRYLTSYAPPLSSGAVR
jgi:hypothetical protein